MSQKRPVTSKRKADQAGPAPQKQPRILGKQEVVEALQSTELANASQFEKDLERRFIAFLTDLELLDTYRHQKKRTQNAPPPRDTDERPD